MKTGANNTSARPEPTAAGAYAAKRNDVARLLDVLDMELTKHADGMKAAPTNWGRVGDLAKARADLVNLVGFFANMDPETVEAFLNDAE